MLPKRPRVKRGRARRRGVGLVIRGVRRDDGGGLVVEVEAS